MTNAHSYQKMEDGNRAIVTPQFTLLAEILMTQIYGTLANSGNSFIINILLL